MAHEADKRFFEKGTNPPQDYSYFAGRFFRYLPSGGFAPFKITTSLTDGAILPIAGGLQVVHTPGHTPGHISLLHRPSEILIKIGRAHV